LLRTHKTRHVGGALTLALALVASLGVGAVGRAAQADGTATPSPTPTAGPATTAGNGLAAPDASTSTSGSPSGRTLVQQVLGAPTVGADPAFVLKRGLTDSVSVAGNDTCTPAPCRYSGAALPPGWGGSISPEGVVTVWVPGRTTPGAYAINYTVTDDNPSPATSQGQLVVAVTPDDFNPPAGMTFTHPYRKGYRTLIRTQVLRTINSVPSGARIQLASWSFAAKAYRVALRDAKTRGVTVQIVLSQRNTRKNSDWRLLANIFGTAITPDGSWVRKCSLSCRGTGGTMHSKIFLFSQAYRTPYVEMTGSANLTDFAVTNQWNQMNTVVNDPAIYNEAVGVFNQMSADRPAPYVEGHFGDIWTYFYPRGRATPS